MSTNTTMVVFQHSAPPLVDIGPSPYNLNYLQ